MRCAATKHRAMPYARGFNPFRVTIEKNQLTIKLYYTLTLSGLRYKMKGNIDTVSLCEFLVFQNQFAII